MESSVTLDNPLPGSMSASINEHFSGGFEHKVDSCIILDLVDKDDIVWKRCLELY